MRELKKFGKRSVSENKNILQEIINKDIKEGCKYDSTFGAEIRILNCKNCIHSDRFDGTRQENMFCEECSNGCNFEKKMTG